MYLRVYEYPEKGKQKFKVIGFKGLRPLPCTEKAAPNPSPWKLDESLCRTRRNIRDAILCNYFMYFCTFTFSDANIDRHDLDACKKALAKFFNNFRVRYAPDFKYYIVPERHADGAWHFHGVVTGIPLNEFTVPDKITVRDLRTGKLKEVSNKKRYVRWARYSKRFGHFDCSRIKHYEACATYISKYITKDLADMCKGKRIPLNSQGLNKPVLQFDEDGVPFEYKPDYEDEFCRMAWITENDAVGKYLPLWYGEQCADLRDLEAAEQARDRAALERAIFEPMTWEQLKLQYADSNVTQACAAALADPNAGVH